ncbi:MAG: hypothetical protein ACK57B_07460 [Betaproteobacteria bacterium]|jgi:hypothetical protein
MRQAVIGLLFGLAGAWPAVAASQQPAPSTGIYTCIDDRGRRLTADRPIVECRHKEQQILNRDGSLRGILQPTLTAEERAAKEARERAAAESRVASADAARRDRNLLLRFPDEASHQRAREAALDPVRAAMRASELRLRELQAARKPLLDEAEFYVGKALPPKLRGALDANDASVEAQRASGATQEAELERINRLYDAELERLRRLWAGAPPGSVPMPQAPAERGGAAARP